MKSRSIRLRALFAAAVMTAAVSLFAQTPAAAGATPPDDTPSFKIGTVVFSDYTWVESPQTTDSDGNVIHPSSFNVTRAYLNFTGNLNHRIAFRITPDIARETGTGPTLTGSQVFRLKFAFGQFNLDDWATKGSWVRLGIQQTPYIDYTEAIYRYRFQGPIFVDRAGFVTASDAGLSGHYNFAGNYGDVHAGFYNGEGFARTEANNEKAFQVRASVRPLPLGGVWKGLRMTAFFDDDHVVERAKRQRAFGQLTFEHPMANAGLELIRTKDQASVTKPVVDAKGWSAWVTPRFGVTGWELLLRHDDLKPNDDLSQKSKRDIFGVAYWMPNLNKVTAALMVDYDRLRQSGFAPSRPDDRRYGLKMLITY